ncbi:acyl-CoA thioesterase [bacterium]|nr:acyl-CoA thioesterase [bacterium]
MKHIFEQKVYFSDTDNYAVVWHGAYLRWMEMGRVDFCSKLLGLGLKDLEKMDILLPVSSINIKYKSSAKLEDIVIVETEVSEYRGLTATFKQVIRSKATDQVFVTADVVIVAVHKDAKLYRRIPEPLASAFEKEIKCLQPD